jgi:prolipoprotein diacylglyceryl transferase
MFYEGGLAFQGALAGALISGAAAARVKKLPFWKTADVIAPYIALGQAVGRIGCFLNGCCYGMIVENGPGITFPGETVMRAPTQVYSSLALLGIFMALMEFREKRAFNGHVFAVYLILYSFFRFFIGFMRGDNPVVFFGMKLSQLISAGMFLCGIVIYAALKTKNIKYEWKK